MTGQLRDLKGDLASCYGGLRDGDDGPHLLELCFNKTCLPHPPPPPDPPYPLVHDDDDVCIMVLSFFMNQIRGFRNKRGIK